MEALIGLITFFFMIVIIVGVTFGFIVRSIAKSRGRKPRLAFWLGFFFTFFALIGYLIAGETEEVKVARLRKVMHE